MLRSRSHPARLPFPSFVARIALGVSFLLIAGQFAAVPAANAVPVAVAPVALGSAETYAVLAGTDIENTGATELTGDLGLSPSGTIAGFGPGSVSGAIHDKDAAAADAQRARAAAYNDAAARVGGVAFAGDQIGRTFEPGLHKTGGVFLNTGTMTLDAGGDANAVFIFQVNAAYSPAAASSVVLAGGAQSANVFWQINGAVTIPAGSTYAGVFLVHGAATIGEGADLPGQVLVDGKVTLANNRIVRTDVSPPVVTIAGGPNATTDDSTPTISGTTDEPVGRNVVIEVTGQPLKTAQVTSGGLWQVTMGHLADATYTVEARVTDIEGNLGTATQSLTVGAPPVDGGYLRIDGGSNRSTTDTTPTITGTTSVAAGSTVSVTVDGQDLVASVAADKTWSVSPTALALGDHTVRASVAGAAGVVHRAVQVITVRATGTPPPAPNGFVAIDGGSNRSTTDTTPTITGTTSVAAGSTVSVTVDGQDLVASVAADKTWSVSPTALALGDHTVRASVAGAAGVVHRAVQVITVRATGTPPPAPNGFVAIDGGYSHTTTDITPAISGTTSEAPGSKVLVTVDGQDLTATVTSGKSWSLVAPELAIGDHYVRASVVGGDDGPYRDEQVLTITTVGTPPPAAERFVTIDGGSSRTVTVAAPPISGRTSEPTGSLVVVSVGGQDLTATVRAGGVWSVVPAKLIDGDYIVTAAVDAGDGRTYRDAQALTVSTAPDPTSPPTDPPAQAKKRFRPDAAIKHPGRRLIGVGIYGGAARQRVTKTLRHDISVTRFVVRLHNRGTGRDRIRVRGTARRSDFLVTYWRGRKNVSRAVKRGTFRTKRLAPRRSVQLTVIVKRARSARPGDQANFRISTNSTSAPIRRNRDAVKARVRIPS